MLKNSSKSYGWVSIALHWLMAIGLIYTFGLGLYMVELTYYDSWYHGSLALHKSIGLLLIAALLLRLSWRWFNTQPAPLSAPHWQQRTAHYLHGGLYAVLAALMLSGFLISTADGKGVSFFELLEVAAIPLSIDNQEDLAGEIHHLLAWLLCAMVALHALAAIKHHLIDKDRTLKRILIAAG